MTRKEELEEQLSKLQEQESLLKKEIRKEQIKESQIQFTPGKYYEFCDGLSFYFFKWKENYYIDGEQLRIDEALYHQFTMTSSRRTIIHRCTLQIHPGLTHFREISKEEVDSFKENFKKAVEEFDNEA